MTVDKEFCKSRDANRYALASLQICKSTKTTVDKEFCKSRDANRYALASLQICKSTKMTVDKEFCGSRDANAYRLASLLMQNSSISTFDKASYSWMAFKAISVIVLPANGEVKRFVGIEKRKRKVKKLYIFKYNIRNIWRDGKN